MSFSANVKYELSNLNNLANKELVKAEFVGYMLSNNTYIENKKVRFATESEYNINRLNKLLNNLDIEYQIEYQGNLYIITFNINKLDILDNELLEKELNVRAIIRGAFMGGGSINNPENTYHLEMLFATKENLNFILNIIKKFYIEGKSIRRKKVYALYIKDSEEISKFLALIGANRSVLEFEEIRVVRDTRNNINRIVNCETANINKIINASVEQINAIKYLEKRNKIDILSEKLKEIAQLRIENPDLSLEELGKKLRIPIGKSGVNHRLKKIIDIANELGLKEKK